MPRTRIPVLRYLLIGLALGFSACLVAFSLYLIKLDQEVQKLYNSVRWTLPAQIYAAPVEIYPGADLSAADLQRELNRVGYRAVSSLDGPGTYVPNGDDTRIDLRPLQFWDGNQAEERIDVHTTGASISQLGDADSGEARDLLRLDPLLIGSIYPTRGGEDRVMVKLADVPALLPQTLILVEDRDFYHHFGISLRGILRAMVADARAGHAVQGASTLTQQLIRNLFLNREVTLKRKLREMLMSVLIERHVSKDQILEAYLNEVWLGQDGARAVHGFGLASHFYFNKPLSELRPQEIAMLVGIVKGPSVFNPRRYPDRVLARRNLVLDMMEQAGLITAQEHDTAVRAPLGISGQGSGPVRYPAFVDLVKQQLQGQYREEDLIGEGLRIFTTLSPRVQEQLEQHISQGLPEVEKAHRMKDGSLESAGVVTTVEGGEVLALVGGRDPRYDGFNRAVDARRPIGSLAKPFVYLTALEQPQRYTLETPLDGSPIAMKQPNGSVWSPENYDRQLHDQVPLYLALAHSYNVPTVHLGLDLGIDSVQKTISAAGFDDVPSVPSIFLGAINMSPLDVAQVYSTLADGGFQTPLLAIHDVLSRDGHPLERYPFKLRRTLPEGPLYLTTWAMQQVFTVGTARWAQSVLPRGEAFAGKTGTTEDLRDSWFAGFGSDRVAVIWVGRDDNQPTRFDGAGGALRIWGPLMRDLHAKGLDSAPPPEIVNADIDPDSGLLADASCPGLQSMPFMQGSAPTTYAPCANAAKSGPVNWIKSLFK